MGHTVASQRIVVDRTIAELRALVKSMRQEDREHADRILASAQQHIGSISYTCSLHVWALVLLTTIIELNRRIQRIEEDYVADRHIQE